MNQTATAPVQRSLLLTMVMPRDGETSRDASAKALSYLFLATGAVAAVAQAADHPTNMTDYVGVGFACILLVLGVACGWAAPRITQRAIELMLLAATLMVGASIAIDANGSSTPAIPFFYLWVCLFACYFLPLRNAMVHLVAIAASYGGGLLIAQPGDNPLGQWLITVCTLAAVGPVVASVRTHVETLIATLAAEATTDPLTRLTNRRGFQVTFDQDLERARRGSGRFSLLVGDLDHFKRINDTFGHGRGDDVLVRVASILDTSRRRIDTVARVGGEEFHLLLPETDEEGARIVAEKLRQKVEDSFSGEQVELTISFGIATFGTDGTTFEELTRAGDKALYAAKELGRNRCVTYSEQIRDLLDRAAEGRETHNKTHLATLLTLAEALDLRDSDTGNHSNTVGRYCQLMARELGMTDDAIERVRMAGILHDIGKIGVPDAVLWKAGPLDDEEWELMKRHPEIGARMLAPTNFTDIIDWIIAHHERVDGTGYPHRLQGEDIPLGARILAVADAYEAMTADRVYRESIGHDAAREELVNCVGTHFDGEVVEAFLRVLDRYGAMQGAEVTTLPLAEEDPLTAFSNEVERATQRLAA